MRKNFYHEGHEGNEEIHVVSECMRHNRIHPLTPFFVPISCLFVFFVVKKDFSVPLWL